MDTRLIYEKFRREKMMYSLFLLSILVLVLFLIYPLLILFYKSLVDPKPAILPSTITCSSISIRISFAAF